ncbi:MFS/sugar transport protein [Pycnococcus provasolii]
MVVVAGDQRNGDDDRKNNKNAAGANESRLSRKRTVHARRNNLAPASQSSPSPTRARKAKANSTPISSAKLSKSNDTDQHAAPVSLYRDVIKPLFTKNQTWDDEVRKAVAYGSAYFAFNCLKTTYQTYSVQLFLDAFKLSRPWFYTGQSALGAWNSVDDTLMALLAHYLHKGSTPALRHACAYTYGGPICAFSYMLMLVPWSTTNDTIKGIHNVVSICVWDCAASYMSVSHQALGTDISQSLHTRTLCKRFEIIALMCTSVVVLCAGHIWDPNKLMRFQVMCAGLVAVSWTIMRWSARTLTDVLEREEKARKDGKKSVPSSSQRPSSPSSAAPASTIRSMRKSPSPRSKQPTPKITPSSNESAATSGWISTAKQIAGNKHFVVWLLTQFCVYCNTCFQMKFFNIFSRELLKGTWAEGQGPTLMGIARMVQGAASFLIVLPAVETNSLYSVFLVGCLISLAMGITSFAVVSWNPTFFIPIALIASVVFASHKAVVGMFISDLVDEDCVLHKRKMPLSSTFFAARSFFTVWAESLVPMATVFVLDRCGWVRDAPLSDNAPPSNAVGCMRTMWWAVPITLTTIQIAMMNLGFGLRGKYLQDIRARRAAM